MALADPDEATVALSGPDHVTMTSPGQGAVTLAEAGDPGGPLGSITLALRLVPLTEDEMEQVGEVVLVYF